jgi:3-oxoacyl-[acyl-carrier protein] reductase
LVIEAIKGAGGKAIAVQTDATAADRVTAAIEKTVATFGKLDVFVNNAGIRGDDARGVRPRDPHQPARGVRHDQAALKRMNDGGRIILIGSCVGERMMTRGLVSYAATKGAIKMFAEGLAREVGDRRITVNNIQPGPIDTELNPVSGDWAVPQKANTALDGYGSGDDVAALVTSSPVRMPPTSPALA